MTHAAANHPSWRDEIERELAERYGTAAERIAIRATNLGVDRWGVWARTDPGSRSPDLDYLHDVFSFVPSGLLDLAGTSGSGRRWWRASSPATRRSSRWVRESPRKGVRTSRRRGPAYPDAMIERAPFGATGHESSRVIFGAAALGDVSKADADRALELVLEHGINHIDVAASYGDAELRIANWLRDHDFFVATKTGERTYAAAREQIRRSLDRLGVDHVDSIQLHNLVDVIEWDIALSPGGALEACIEARDEGLVRFIGVTGHGLSHPQDAPAQPRALRLRLRAVPVQPRADAGRALRGDLRRARGASARSATSRCRRSRAWPTARGRAASTPRRPGTSR